MTLPKTVLPVLVALLMCSPLLHAQSGDNDVFVPISKYLAKGDVDALSAWYARNLEITVLGQGGNFSRKQATQILKTFFDTYTPRSFLINHTTSRANMKYALGVLNAGGEHFMVTIFVSFKGESYQIQQMKIERVQ